MIDFRYHLVSVIAIFMALAVGIVLGAGPLKEDIGTTLTSELTRARQDKADLNAQLGQSRKTVTAGESYASATRSLVVKGRLDGKRVAVVAASGADDRVVSAVETTLGESGATISQVVRLGDEWTHPDESGGLGKAVNTAAKAVSLDTSSVDSGQLPGTVLGRTLLTSTVKDGYRADSASASAALEALRSAGVLTTRTSAAEPATLVVTIAAPMSRPGTGTTTRQVEGYTALLRGMDSVCDGSVLVAPSRPVDDKDQVSAAAVVSGVRSNRAAAAAVATVDDADLAMGQAAAIVALAAQLDGRSGRYGTGPDAEAVLPELKN